jgi:hypothetical protein
MSDVFKQSARSWYLNTSTTETAAYTHVPTITLEEQPETTDDTWYSTDNVATDGTAFQDGATTGQAMGYNFETKMFKTDDATPELIDVLKIIKGCQDKSGADVEKDCVIVEPDGTKKQVKLAILNVTTMYGETNSTGGIKGTLKRRGAPTAFTGSLS